MPEQTVFEAPGFRGNVVGALGDMLVIDAAVDGDIPAHAAEADELAVVISGQFELNISRFVRICRAGDYMIVPQGSDHWIRMIEPGRLLLICKA
jgi:quercetin dioxygenase-like cupin family protein